MTRTPDKDVAKFLKRVLTLLGPNGEHWTKGASVLKAGNHIPMYEATRGCKFCLQGALVFVGDRLNAPGYVAARRAVEHVIPDQSIISFNDAPSRRFSSIKRVLKEAIRNCNE